MKFKLFEPKTWFPEEKTEVQKQAYYNVGGLYGNILNSYVQNYDGEKNLGEIGPIKNLVPDYYALNLRSWQSYTESEISKTILDKFVTWIIDKGLKLQANPVKKILEQNNINIDSEEFNEQIEMLFQIWAKSTYSSYDGMGNLHSIAKEAYKNAKIGGDVLVVLTYDGSLKVRLIDGALVYKQNGANAENGNKIINGVEVNKKGKHIAYHVVVNGKSERIEAYNTIGLRSAYLVYGNRHRLNTMRGMPVIAIALESLKKLERYKEAAVGSAEERQKIAYTIEHAVFSDGSSPLVNNIATAYDLDAGGKNIPVDINGTILANKVAATTNKQTFNMTPGSKLTSLESRNEMFFRDFYEKNADLICASVGIPPNVAFSIYNDSFSASRAATKDWDHTIDVNRDDFSFQFYQPIYNFYLHLCILQNKISAPKYLRSYNTGEWMVVESYRNCRFTGPMFPHIDPLKEVNAERAKLGELAKHLPLTTLESATEVLNGGDSVSNTEQFSKELEKAKQLGLEAVLKVPIVENSQDDKENDKKKENN